MARSIKKASRILKDSESTQNSGFFDNIQKNLESSLGLDNQSLVSLVLGVLIVIVVGVLVFNYLNKPAGEIGVSDQVSEEQGFVDVKREDLPGDYQVKEGDTLFLIAQQYYGDGFKYPEIVGENNLANENSLEVGQVLRIPKLESASLPQVSPSASPAAQADSTLEKGMGGAENQTIWGERVTGDSYTVIEGDWLSTIAGRAYGDVQAYQKIAQANNISNPDLIYPGTILKIPR